jgi:CRISPR/Cas system CMR-associated protein Cmr3 (group 5 of RAMP superfamily)
VKKSYIYSALERHKLATEQLAHLHKSPIEKAKSTITFLKFTSDEYLQNFKVDNRYQTIFLLQRVVEKEELIQRVHDKCRVFQEEIKAFYVAFEPLMDKGLPFFWDAENRLLRRDDYDNLVVAKRNDHSNFEDLEGNLRGEILVTKLGDVFELLHMIKMIALPHTEVEEYINLEILFIQMKDIMLPTKNHFKELIKMAVKRLGLIPLTF